MAGGKQKPFYPTDREDRNTSPFSEKWVYTHITSSSAHLMVNFKFRQQAENTFSVLVFIRFF